MESGKPSLDLASSKPPPRYSDCDFESLRCAGHYECHSRFVPEFVVKIFRTCEAVPRLDAHKARSGFQPNAEMRHAIKPHFDRWPRRCSVSDARAVQAIEYQSIIDEQRICQSEILVVHGRRYWIRGKQAASKAADRPIFEYSDTSPTAARMRRGRAPVARALMTGPAPNPISFRLPPSAASICGRPLSKYLMSSNSSLTPSALNHPKCEAAASWHQFGQGRKPIVSFAACRPEEAVFYLYSLPIWDCARRRSTK